MTDTGIADALARVTPLLAQHVLLAGSALLLGILIAVPLGVVSARRPAVARIALGFASLVQTIPSLALLALFYPLLLALSALVGGGIPALGFLPSLIALTLYALLPILRNAVTGLRGIDRAVIEAADGVGMTPWQKLRLVEAPLVAPVLIAGIRTAAVWTIGAATLSTTVGQPSLGDMIFAGLQTQNWTLVLAGCIAAALLAMTVDGTIGLIEHGLATRRRGFVVAGIAILAAGLALATVPLWHRAGPRTIVVGAKNFSEQYILARLIGDRLRQAGYDVQYRDGLGSAVIYGALKTNDVDVYVDYAGTIWTNEMKRTTVPSRAAMVAAIGAWMQAGAGTRLVGALGFENAYAFAMRGDEAKAKGIATLDDLRVILPNIGPGMASGAILAFGVSFNEIAMVQILAGDRFETVPLYTLNLLKSTDADFNVLAVMTTVSFIITLLLSVAVVYFNRGAADAKRAAAAADDTPARAATGTPAS